MSYWAPSERISGNGWVLNNDSHTVVSHIPVNMISIEGIEKARERERERGRAIAIYIPDIYFNVPADDFLSINRSSSSDIIFSSLCYFKAIGPWK